MKKLALQLIATVLVIFSSAWVAQAGVYTNNFDTTFNYTNGIPASTWDGVYLGVGDVPNGSTTTAGKTVAADINISFPFLGFLSVEETGGGWQGNRDDGFYIWKLVSGDFDASVLITAPYNNAPNNFCGLLTRAFTTNGPVWGGPFSPSDTNAAENWLSIRRFNEFSFNDLVRWASNNNDQVFSPQISTNYNTETNTTRYLRINRTGDTFTFYDKTNDTDSWALETNLSRPDLHGISMQVGIEQSLFTANPAVQVIYANFSINGPNVGTTPVPPADPTGPVTAVASSCTNITFGWNAGTGSDGSIVVLRMNGPIIANPIPGLVYNANSNFGSGDELAGREFVVYQGTGNTVTVNGLLGSNNTYSAAVYSYKGSGSAINYGTNPVVSSTPGPGTLTAVTFSLTPTNIPVGGAALATVTATYCAGDSYNVSSDPTTIWQTGNLSVAAATNGTVTGIGVGSSTVMATYKGVTGNGTVTVNNPAYSDNFSTSQSYITNGLAGTGWDGVYMKQGDIPHGGGGNLVTSALDANITSNGCLTMRAGGGAWEGGGDNGPFLFKQVPGDFQTSVHITGYNNTVGYLFVGLQARGFNNSGTAGMQGAPNGAGFTENHVNWWRFDQFGVTSSARSTVNGTYIDLNPIYSRNQNDVEAVDFWLLMERVSATNFYFFKKQNQTDPWLAVPAATFVRPDLTNGVPMQVGLAEATYTSAFGPVTFDHFMLDAANIVGANVPTPATGLTMNYNSANNTMTLTWVPGTNADSSPVTSFVVMRANAPISAQPTFGILTTASPLFGAGTDLGSGNYLVFRGVGNTVTVSGLTPGNTYYAAVYGYFGSGTTKSFNQAGSSSAATTAGHVTNLVVSLPATGIPLGGAGLPTVLAQFDSGGLVDISTVATATSTNSSIIITTNNVLTGVGLGSTYVQVSASGFTNTVLATVRAPVFTDNFGTLQDYKANGVTGTAWDGVYASVTNIPGKTYVSTGASQISSAVAQTNVLSVSSENVGFEFGQDDGFFLFKWVGGDFQSAVHVFLDNGAVPSVANNNPGILARAYGYDTNGNVGAPYGGTNGAESWVSWTRFDEFGIGTYARLTLANGTTRSTQPAQGDTNYWLLMVRRNYTNFSFYERTLPTQPWAPAPNGTFYNVAAFNGVPMQVGIYGGGFNSSNPVLDQFDTFMLDAEPSNLTITKSGGNVTLTWSALTGGTLYSTLSLSSPNWQPVPGPSNVLNGMVSITLPSTGTATFYRVLQALP
jgi:hypothetical protein